MRVLGGVGVLVSLDEVFESEQPTQLTVGVDKRQLLNLVGSQQRKSVRRAGSHWSGDEWGCGHDLADRTLWIVLKAHVTVRDDTDQVFLVVDDGHPGYPVGVAKLLGVSQGGIRGDRDGLVNHAGLRTLHLIDHGSLILNGQVAVQDAKATFTRHSDRHPGLGDGVHRRADERNRNGNVAGNPRRRLDLGGNDVTLNWLEQDVIEGEGQRCQLLNRGRAGIRGHKPPFAGMLAILSPLASTVFTRSLVSGLKRGDPVSSPLSRKPMLSESARR